MKKHSALLSVLLIPGVLLADMDKYSQLLDSIKEQDYSQVTETLLDKEPISIEQLDQLIEEAKVIEAELRNKTSIKRWAVFLGSLATCGLIWKFVPDSPEATTISFKTRTKSHRVPSHSEHDFKELLLAASFGIGLYGLLRDWMGNVRNAKHIVEKLAMEKRVLQLVQKLSNR